MTHYPLGTTAVKGIESQPRKTRSSPVVTAERWPAAVCILRVKQQSDSRVAFADQIGRQCQKGQGRGFDGRLSRICGERPAALGQLAVDELLNASLIQLLIVAHGLGSRGEPPDCQIS